MKKEKILVTGGAGFIGSHLVEALLHGGHRVCVVDNLIHGERRRIPKQVRFVEQDIRDKNLSKTFKTFSPQIVFHLAAQHDVVKANEDPQNDAAVNILGTLNVLDCCRETSVARIIYADSVAGFGEPQKLPIPVDHQREPQSFYGISKHTIEHYLKVYQRYFGLDFVALILANVYGPRQDPFGEGGVVAIFGQRMTHHQEVVIYGDGKQTRDFIFVSDAVRAFLQARYLGTNQFHMIGTGKKTSINNLSNLMKKLSGYRGSVKHVLPRPGDVQDSVFKVEKTKKYLLWKSQVGMVPGLRETLGYFATR